MPEQRGIGTRAGQRDADAGRGLDDPRGDLDQPQAEGGELGGSERGGLRQRLAQAPHQPVGCGVEEEPHLVGVGGAARGAVALQLGLVELDQVLGLATGAVKRVVDMFGAATVRSSIATGRPVAVS